MKDAGKWDEFLAQCKSAAKEKAKVSATATKPAVATTSMQSQLPCSRQDHNLLLELLQKPWTRLLPLVLHLARWHCKGSKFPSMQPLLEQLTRKKLVMGRKLTNQVNAASHCAQFGRAAQKRAQESKSDKYPSFDEPVPKKPKAKLKSMKEVLAGVVLAAIDPENDPQED